MFIFKKASHLDRKHYNQRHKHTKKVEEVALNVKIEPEVKEIPVVIAEKNPFEETPEVKKPRTSKKNAVVAETTEE